ncbi:MAG TPA: helix-turn-helix transcriptional regulator [Pseudonocardiaceae bacterium]|jgi:transcriptional regulator with XRE-family HTH domain|nr:helix-turn-helix transcriptional regulator [Pseudonocardiaceae bacterium]
MGQARQTFERRQLGLALRRFREDAHKSQLVSAEVLGKVRSVIVALEDGSATATPEELELLLDFYGVTGKDRKTTLILGDVARKRQKRRTHIDALPDAYQRFADLERNASEINCHEAGIIPGLLQCEDYVRSLMAEGEGVWWEPDDPEGEERLRFRLTRLAKLFDPGRPKILRFVMTEDALHARMDKLQTMRGQLEHILMLIGQHKDLTVRVLPNDVYGNPLRGRNLVMFGFGHRGTPIGFSETAFGPSTYYDNEADTSDMLRAFYRAWELSLTKTASHQLIERLYREM